MKQAILDDFDRSISYERAQVTGHPTSSSWVKG